MNRWLSTPALSMRTLKSESSSNGAGFLRSTCTSNPAEVAATTKIAMASSETPVLATCCSPRIKLTAIENNVIMPSGSKECVPCFEAVSGSIFHAMNAAANATGRLRKKIQRQPNVSMSKPASDGPVI